MLFHISSDRWDSILAKSYKLEFTIVAHERLPSNGDGGNVYHVIDSDGYCNNCNGVFASIPATTPVELEEYKLSVGG